MLAAGGLFVVLLGSLLVDQITMIGRNLPDYVDDVVLWLNKTFGTDLSVGKLQDNVLHSDWLRNYVQNQASNVWGLSGAVLGGVFQLLTIALFTFYLAADGPGCAAPCAPYCRRRARRRCCVPGRSRWPRPAAICTPAC